MDQIKEILKQAIKYRFWIAVGVSALLPMIAYFLGVGAVRDKAKAETDAIVSEKDVKGYASGTIPNKQYKPIVAEKTEELTKDVNESWKKLYSRQAPLLTWPERVQERFTSWGRKWPENVDPSAVQIAIIDYVNAYPAFVTEVYKSFRPFDPVEGTGVVSAAPEAMLLRPAPFAADTPPDLGKVWAAQERLWIQRTLLDVVASVNKNAKTWDDAPIKQINSLEVGSAQAQDQQSIAKGETLEEAPAITDPSKPADAAETTTAAPAGGSPESNMMMMMGGSAGMGASGASETVSYLKGEGGENAQFKTLPVEMSVLIEQDRIPDFLVALENSPMTIQVKDFELSKPLSRVTKPEKGASMAFGGMGGYGEMGMGGMMGSGGGRGMMGMSGFGGMMRSPDMGGYGGGGAGMMGMGMMGGMMGPGGMGGGGDRKGVDARTKNRAEEAKKALEAAKKKVSSSLHDPYYNIVEVKVYGQARFFNPPPVEAPAEATSAGDAATPAPDAEKKAEGEPEKKAEEPKADEAKKVDAPKAEEAKKAEAPKAEEPKKEGEPKADEAKKADEPKAEAPKAEAPKAEEPKKAEAPQPK